MKAEQTHQNSITKRETTNLKESLILLGSKEAAPKNLKKTTSAKIFKASDLEVSTGSVNLKVAGYDKNDVSMSLLLKENKQSQAGTKADDSLLNLNNTSGNQIAGKTRTQGNTSTLDFNEIKKKLILTEGYRANKKNKRNIVGSADKFEKFKKTEFDRSQVIKNISPRHSRSPKGSTSGSGLLRVLCADQKSSVLVPKKTLTLQMASSSAVQKKQSPTVSILIPESKKEEKVQRLGDQQLGQLLTTASLFQISNQQKKKPTVAAYQKKIESLMKKK